MCALHLIRYVFKLADFGTARELGEDETFFSLHGTEEYLYPAMYERALVNPSKKHEFCAKVVRRVCAICCELEGMVEKHAFLSGLGWGGLYGVQACKL